MDGTPIDDDDIFYPNYQSQPSVDTLTYTDLRPPNEIEPAYLLSSTEDQCTLDPEGTIRLDEVLQPQHFFPETQEYGQENFDSTWTASDLQQQLGHFADDVCSSRERKKSLFEDLEEISGSTDSQRLSQMENMLVEHSSESSGMLPELSGQFLNIHLNSSRPQSVYSSSSSVFHSGELGPPAGWSGANSSHNSPSPSVSGALSSFPSEEQSTNSPLMTSSSYPNQPQLTRQSLQGPLDVKQLLKHKLQGKQQGRDRIYSDPIHPLMSSPLSPSTSELERTAKFRSPSVSVGSEALKDDEEVSLRRSSLMLERRKERNRQSAAKCREKQKQLEIYLQTQKASLSEKHTALKREVEELERERIRLQQMVLSYDATCNRRLPSNDDDNINSVTMASPATETPTTISQKTRSPNEPNYPS